MEQNRVNLRNLFWYNHVHYASILLVSMYAYTCVRTYLYLTYILIRIFKTAYTYIYIFIAVAMNSRDRYEIIGLRKISHFIKQPCRNVCLEKAL